jgi:hypothetical protein
MLHKIDMVLSSLGEIILDLWLGLLNEAVPVIMSLLCFASSHWNRIRLQAA